MTSKKHHKKKCCNHPERPAHGTCSACGKPLCTACSLIVRGKWHCFAPHCRPKELINDSASINKLVTQPQKSVQQKKSLHSRALLTILLCGLVLILFAAREIVNLRAENRLLRESRSSLISIVQNNNETQKELEYPILPPSPDTNDPKSATARQTPQPPRFAPTPILRYQPTNHLPYHIANGSQSLKAVALTFDGGSTANVTREILDTLASRSVIATMFLTGEFIRKFPEITRLIVTHGHECGNHTAGHLHLTTYAQNQLQSTLPSITVDIITQQLIHADALFHATSQRHFAPLWRAPYGEFNREICEWGYRTGYVHIGWRQGKTWFEGLDSNDWIPDSTVAGYKTPEEFLDKICRLSTLEYPGINGGIILMHLGTERKNPALQTHRVLGRVIDTLRAHDYSIIPVTQMVAATGIDLALLPERSDIQ